MNIVSNVASAWRIMEAAMHAEYFSRQGFSKDHFLHRIGFSIFNVKTIE